MKPILEIDIPKAYVIPQGWWNVIELLELNQVEMTRIENDTTLYVTSYKIDSYETRRQPYEGHYGHYDVKLSKSQIEKTFKKGDRIVYTNQKALRYLMETLEPEGPDSFFNWNFFDTILQQKEGFSPYVWEDKAQALLIQYPKLQVDFNLKKTYDTDFANNWYAQLEWLHKQSEFYEKAHLQYPIYRME